MPSAKFIWGGRAASALAALFLTFDAVIKLMQIAPVVEGFAKLGYPDGLAIPIGVVLLISTALYVIPRTAVLGAILLTGYLGGAVATNVRVAAPLFTHVLFPVYTGVFVWGGLWLRDRRISALIPLRQN